MLPHSLLTTTLEKGVVKGLLSHFHKSVNRGSERLQRATIDQCLNWNQGPSLLRAFPTRLSLLGPDPGGGAAGRDLMRSKSDYEMLAAYLTWTQCSVHTSLYQYYWSIIAVVIISPHPRGSQNKAKKHLNLLRLVCIDAVFIISKNHTFLWRAGV